MASRYTPKRGDLVFTDFDPAAGQEQKMKRPALILSSEPFNKKIKLALVAPITSTTRGHGFEVQLADTRIAGVVLCHQVKVIDYGARGVRFIEQVPSAIVADVLAKVRLLVN